MNTPSNKEKSFPPRVVVQWDCEHPYLVSPCLTSYTGKPPVHAAPQQYLSLEEHQAKVQGLEEKLARVTDALENLVSACEQEAEFREEPPHKLVLDGREALVAIKGELGSV